MNFDRILGMVLIIFGLCLALWAVGDLIFRILIALLGLFVVNFGMRMRGMPPLYITIMRMWSTRYDF